MVSKGSGNVTLECPIKDTDTTQDLVTVTGDIPNEAVS